MSLAEKKIELLQIVVNADEEMTGKLIEFAYSLQNDFHPSTEAVAFYEKRRDEFFASGEKGLTKEESLSKLRELLK